MAAVFHRPLKRGQPTDVMELDDGDDAPVAVAPPAQVVLPLQPRAFKMQFHGTWSHTNKPGRLSPKDMPKHVLGDLVMKTQSGLFQATAASRGTRLNRLTKVSVFEEKHASGDLHYHFPTLAEHPWYCGPLQQKLGEQGIDVDFSTAHDYYWTTIVYLAVPGTGPNDKREEDLDPDPWLSEGHPPIIDCLKEIPRGARATDKARVRRYLSVQDGVESKNKDVAFSDKEFAAHIIAKNVRTKLQLQAWIATVTANVKRSPKYFSVDERVIILVGLEML